MKTKTKHFIQLSPTILMNCPFSHQINNGIIIPTIGSRVKKSELISLINGCSWQWSYCTKGS